jgi:hypothetical protein
MVDVLTFAIVTVALAMPLLVPVMWGRIETS